MLPPLPQRVDNYLSVVYRIQRFTAIISKATDENHHQTLVSDLNSHAVFVTDLPQ
jgi:hypothetical protein